AKIARAMQRAADGTLLPPAQFRPPRDGYGGYGGYACGTTHETTGFCAQRFPPADCGAVTPPAPTTRDPPPPPACGCPPHAPRTRMASATPGGWRGPPPRPPGPAFGPPRRPPARPRCPSACWPGWRPAPPPPTPATSRPPRAAAGHHRPARRPRHLRQEAA